MKFQKSTISVTLALLALAAQQHIATASPQSESHASTRYDVILKQLGLQSAQPQTTQSQSQKSMIGTNNQLSTPHASTRYDAILKQLELQSAQPQITQSQAIPSQTPESQTSQLQSQKSISADYVAKPFFSHPPQLVRAAAFPNGGNVPSTYAFTLTVPDNVGQPLKAVTITQATNVQTVRFNATNTKAFLGRRLASGSEIQLVSIGGEQPANPGEATIVFAQPVQPGKTVTIALPVQNNPQWSGVYLFGITAYPDGENGQGQFLGYGRIHFYGNSN